MSGLHRQCIRITRGLEARPVAATVFRDGRGGDRDSADGPALAASGDGADLIFHGGPVIPLAGFGQYAEALAVKNGKIIAVGTSDAVMGLKANSTQVIDLDGRAVLPGFIDPHQHTVTGALINAIFTDCGYTKYQTRDALLAMFRDKAEKTPPGQWLLFTSFDNLLQGGDLMMPDLDAISKVHPILVYYINMHTAAGNSAAFAAAKIPDDIGSLAGGGRFGRDAAGKLNGMIYEESALKKFAVAIPKITPQLAGKAVIDWLKVNASFGNTSVHEAGVLVFGNLLEDYERVAAQAPCRASISLMYESMKDAEPYEKYGFGAAATQIPNTMMTIYAMKIVGDGSNQTKSAAQTVPYLNDTEKGSPNFDATQMKSMVADVKAHGWPVSIHCNGDETLDIALDAIEAAYGPFPRQASTESSTVQLRASNRSNGWRASASAELPDEPRLLLRRVPGPALRRGPREPHGPCRRLRADWPAVHDPHRCAANVARSSGAGRNP